MRKWLLVLAVVAGLALVVLLVSSAADGARQTALLDARFRDAEDWERQAYDRMCRLKDTGAPAEDIAQAEMEANRAHRDFESLRYERDERAVAWHARLLYEARRHTGW